MIEGYSGTQMYGEAAQASDRVEQQSREIRPGADELGRMFGANRFHTVLTCARGSSDHAATYAKYLIETELGVPVASFAPSIASVYHARQRLEGALFLAISQSGESPDLLAAAEHAKKYGACVAVLVNNTSSPLADGADIVIPMGAGPELSVAATKSFICSLCAIVRIVEAGANNTKLSAALPALPSALSKAWLCDWSEAIEPLASATNLFVISRGLGLSIACEAALKLKETCALHAEGYSAAEVKHGPMAIASDGFPVLAFAPSDKTGLGFDTLIEEFSSRGVICMVAGLNLANALHLPSVDAGAHQLTPIVQILSFYRFANALSCRRGLNPDAPPFLKKITETR